MDVFAAAVIGGCDGGSTVADAAADAAAGAHAVNVFGKDLSARWAAASVFEGSVWLEPSADFAPVILVASTAAL